VKFIFATTEIHKVPITIRSRCQRHDLRLIPHAMVSTHVRRILSQEGVEADDDAIAIVVREAGGSLRDALTVVDQLLAFGGDRLKGEDVARGLGIADQRSVLAVADALLGGDAASCLRGVVAVGEQGLDILHFARSLLSLVRDLVVLRVVGDDPQLVDRGEEERRRAAELAQRHSPQQLERTFAGLAQLVDEVGQTAHPQIVLEMGLVRLADRPPLEPLSELLARLLALEARIAPGGGGVPGGERGAGPSGGGGSGRGARRAAPAAPSAQPVQTAPTAQPAVAAPTAPIPQPSAELRTPGRLDPRPRRGEPGPRRANEPESEPPPPPSFASGAAASAAPDRGEGDVPEAWQRILGAVQAAQPALGAVLEHGVPVQVDAARLLLSFPEGSFFGRQAASGPARQALAEAAHGVLGQQPRIEIAFGVASARPTVAAQQAARQKEKRAEIVEVALSHPRVKEAMDVFPEAEGNVEVQVEVEG